MENLADNLILTPIRRLGHISLSVVGNMGRMGVFLVQSLFCTFTPPLKFFRVLLGINGYVRPQLRASCIVHETTGRAD